MAEDWGPADRIVSGAAVYADDHGAGVGFQGSPQEASECVRASTCLEGILERAGEPVESGSVMSREDTGSQAPEGVACGYASDAAVRLLEGRESGQAKRCQG